MLLYHVTRHAKAIMASGFRDGAAGDNYGFGGAEVTGVFLSDAPVGIDEAAGDVLVVEFPDGFDMDPYAVVEEGAPLAGAASG